MPGTRPRWRTMFRTTISSCAASTSANGSSRRSARMPEPRRHAAAPSPCSAARPTRRCTLAIPRRRFPERMGRSALAENIKNSSDRAMPVRPPFVYRVGHGRATHCDHRLGLLGALPRHPAEAGRDRLVHDLREVGPPRRHVARQHLPGRRLRRPVLPLLLLVRAEDGLVAEVVPPGRDPRLHGALRAEVRPGPPHPLRHRDRRRPVRCPGGRLAPARERRWLTRFPLLARLHRWSIWLRLELRFPMIRGNRFFAWMARRAAEQNLRDHVADPRLRAALTPDYPIGGKRVLISDDYYPTLARDNVEVVTDRVARLTEDAVVTRDGRAHPVDAVILATGFETTAFLAPMRIAGLDGRSLDAEWADRARADRGIAVPGFPNLFLMYGPNPHLGHNAIRLMI